MKIILDTKMAVSRILDDFRYQVVKAKGFYLILFQ